MTKTPTNEEERTAMKKLQTDQPGVIRVDGKVVGRVIAGVFIKRVDGSKHFLHTPPAIAFNVSSLKAAKANGAVYVHITDTGTDLTYVARIEKIEREGFKVERGYGDQIALPLNQWARTLDEIRATQPRML